nr:hypothetical protein [Chamaesiphon sp. VAR_48_metabat_135_sub]
MGDRRAAKLTFDRGTLEITMPLEEHEFSGRLIELFIRILVVELGLKIKTMGSTAQTDEVEAEMNLLDILPPLILYHRNRYSGGFLFAVHRELLAVFDYSSTVEVHLSPRFPSFSEADPPCPEVLS